MQVQQRTLLQVIALGLLLILLSQASGHGGTLSQRPAVKTGLDVLVAKQYQPLRGRRVGLICNHSAVNSRGEHIISLFLHQNVFQLKALFSPEHGLWGKEEESVASGIDPETGLKFYSLYGETLRPTADSFKDIDTLVFDIQDVGARFYTYISTMAMCMEEAARHNVGFVVLDRPNPISGTRVEGPVLDEIYQGQFISYFPLPVAHGMTVGELALMFNREFGIGCDLTVIRMRGWRRRMWFDETRLPWVNPSPNIRNLAAATLYPGFGIVERAGVSVGRGTIAPFELYGAPWMDGKRVAEEMNKIGLPGLQFAPVEFTPDRSVFTGQMCSGVRIVLTDRTKLECFRAGLTFVETIYRLHGDAFEIDAICPMVGDPSVAEKIKGGVSIDEIIAGWRPRLRAFLRGRERYLLYP
jgi:uncharacterized protein YbbC (DUF1343 family)